MEFLEINQNNCRICLKSPSVLDWNEEILDLCGTTYKNCYYQYTQLEAYDPFPQMLCETCSSDLKNCHFLIQTALKSYDILQQTYATFNQSIDIEEKIDIKEQLHDSGEFETVFFEKPNGAIDNTEDKDSFSSLKDDTLLEISEDLEKMQVQKKSKAKEVKISKNLKKVLNDKKSKLKKVRNHKESKNNKKKLKTQIFSENLKEDMDISPSPSNSDTAQAKVKVAGGGRKIRRIMCAYCPRLIIAQYMKRHEETHQDRDREVACPTCGIKYFNKRALYAHMFIHKENREKKHKCDYCDKAYYDRGALNIHRRIHLGQMIPCPICPKEFYRQVDLDKHKARTHGAAGLGNKNEKRTYYIVECKECGKNVPSHSWKEHQVRHTKKMQMKCTLCDKHFGTKRSCHSHVRRFHKYKDDFDKVVLYYGDDISKRYSIIMLKQTEVVKPTFEGK